MSKTKHHRVAQSVQRRAAEVRQKTADSFVNAGARLGFGGGSQQDGAAFMNNYVSRNPFQLEAAYRTNWVCGMVVDAVAQDMTRAGVEFVSDEIDPDDQKAMHKAFEDLALWAGLCDAVKWGRLYGGGILVLLVDGQNMSTPLRLDTVGKDQFKGVVALDRYQVNPSLSNLVTDFGPDLGKPKFYEVTPAACALIGERIHYSRVIRIDGLDLPWRQRIAENGWGQSILERLWDRIVAFDSTTEGAAQLVYKAHLRTLKIPQLREIISMGGPAFDGLKKQIDFMRAAQSNEGLTVLDGSDEFETHQYSFSGLADMLLQFGQQLSGATQIPLVRLFGQSPAGMNSTGESDLVTYYDNVGAQQDQKLRRGVGVLTELVHRSTLGKPLPDGFEFNFVPLWQMSAEEKANVAKTVTEAITSAEAAGVISPATAAKELRQVSRETGVFSHIEDADIDMLDSEPPDPAELLAAANPAPGNPAKPGAPALAKAA